MSFFLPGLATPFAFPKSVLDIARIVLDGWRARSPTLAHAFDYTLLNINESRYPPRAFTFQCREISSLTLVGATDPFVVPCTTCVEALVNEDLAIQPEHERNGQNGD